MTPLGDLLHQSRSPDAEVAWRREDGARAGGAVRWEEFRLDVARLRESLSGEPTGGWLLVTEDAYAFAVGLYALWHSGRHAILPPNLQPGTLSGLVTRASGVITDHTEWVGEGRPIHPLQRRGGGDPDSLGPISVDALAVELFTSGTTGGEKSVIKHIHHLAAEVEVLSEVWSSLVGSSMVFSTASHQHLYGLLFGVLWPLSAGHVFHAQHFLHMGEMLPRMLETDSCVLASVPTTLKRLARHARTPLLRDRCRAIFSSGGPLAEETALEIGQQLGTSPIEVLGSTETGGIALRQQKHGQGISRWTSLPAVRVTRDHQSGLLRVSSPFVSVGHDEDGFSTGDRISLHEDGRFVLEGRSDQVVKVGEKRLDLEQMASLLRGHEWVDEVTLAAIDRDGELRVAAVVVPSVQGNELIEREGRRRFSRGLRVSLAPTFDPILHPRFWRTVAELPTNDQGKVPLEAIRSLFGGGQSGGGVADRPEVLDELSSHDFIERSCRVPLDLACFPGHFPGRPLVPGVLQLDWALELAAQLLGAPPQVVEIESLKLSSPLRPGQRFRIRSRLAENAKVEFKVWSRDSTHATGRVRLKMSSESSP